MGLRLEENSRGHALKGMELGIQSKSAYKMSQIRGKKRMSIKIIEAPMPGKIINIKVKEGDMISKGDVVLILESMKMELEIIAEFNGLVKEIKAKQLDFVNTGAPLVIIEDKR